MTSVEDFNLRLSATKDTLVGLQKSDPALAPLQEDELRSRVQSLVSFLAGIEPGGALPPWFVEVTASAEDYLMDCLRSSMVGGGQAPRTSPPPPDTPIEPRPRPWWRFWGQ
ncbi:hypothetical protein GCM10007874_45290 [Labrys miyagiensis]|uniref:Uncharacterized protein n=1 Tax=Labrys miyagiensis TaxID=346912 RepID=A0ABQ6CMC6_9HYPH|nr:hypothetical protein [Labrys miyagiensis]GLS21512.1 hypothetical protein GCM10007874_45290 [Labrys miyagiensis]